VFGSGWSSSINLRPRYLYADNGLLE